MTLLRILDLACSLFGWHRNPFDRELDRRWWAALRSFEFLRPELRS